MITIIAVSLVTLWLIGLVAGSTLGGFIHALLVVAIAIVMVRLIEGRSTYGQNWKVTLDLRTRGLTVGVVAGCSPVPILRSFRVPSATIL